MNARIPLLTQEENAINRLWVLVGNAMHDQAPECWKCDYFRNQYDKFTGQGSSRCLLKTTPYECPALERLQSEQEEKSAQQEEG